MTYVRHGAFRGLSNQTLRDLGSELEFYPGIPEVFEDLRRRLEGHQGARQHETRLEHYVVSTGLRQTILGSAIAGHIDGVWGCEFVETDHPPGFLDREPIGRSSEICQVGYVLDNTTKTRAIFEINKGSNKFTEIDVNSFIVPEDRRVPFQNMIYVADGPSDVPVFSVVHSQGGRTYAVYHPGDERRFAQANQLLAEGRVHAFGEADYRTGTPTAIWLGQAVDEIATRSARDRNSVLTSRVGQPPRHIT